jgi:hypothetical protein
MKVKYMGATIDQVRCGGNNDPRLYLKIGESYEVLDEEVHSWHTKLILKEFPELKFNSVCFEEV